MIVDCLIIGAGPAGLTAAIYASRFHLTVKVMDGGNSRAALIPRTMNHAGFPIGISGKELLCHMRVQAVKYGATISDGFIHTIELTPDGFTARSDFSIIDARVILLATGVSNRRPGISDIFHAEALRLGRLRYCPVCDGYEVTDKKIGVLGTGARAVKEAEFLRSYSSKVILLVIGNNDGLDEKERAHLAAIQVPIVFGSSLNFELIENGISACFADGSICFDTIYVALGSSVHSSLAIALGADVTEEGCIKVDSHQRTSVRGLYAAGDVVIGLDQISHAMGEAGVAATTIRNDLAAENPMLR